MTTVAFDSIDADGGLIGGIGCLGCEQSRRVTLEPGDADTIAAVQFRLWNSSTAVAFSDPVRATVYSDGSSPGGVLTSVTQPLQLAPDENRVVTFDLPDTLLVGESIWIGLYTPSESVLIWTTRFDGAPLIGSMSNSGRTRDGGIGPWTGSSILPVTQQARVLMIPAPGSVVGLIGLGAIIQRRRRDIHDR
ncbi:MAG: hypothetical protein ACTS22_06120 [Phycisphaerales bacterium]